MEFLSWDGTLSSRDFHVAARAFAENWKQFNPALPPWTWVPSRLSEQGYLSLEKICLVGSSREHEQKHVDEEEPVDNATLVRMQLVLFNVNFINHSCIYHFVLPYLQG